MALRGDLNRRRGVMNRDQVKGRMKEASGTIQEKAGKATGNRTMQAKGLLKRGLGKLQKTAGDSRDDAEKGRM
jgi:uncharacterized protein YjbJ (UPF0337 family)